MTEDISEMISNNVLRNASLIELWKELQGRLSGYNQEKSAAYDVLENRINSLEALVQLLRTEFASLGEIYHKIESRFNEIESKNASEKLGLQTDISKLNAVVAALRKSAQVTNTEFKKLHVRIIKLENRDRDTESKKYQTNQEAVWSGTHGDLYVDHHIERKYQIRVPFWEKFLGEFKEIRSVCEFGCNIGDNLLAIGQVDPEIGMTGIEINGRAADKARERGIEVIQDTILSADVGKKYDLVFTRGVLIHIKPELLRTVYENMIRHASKYILIREIYSESLTGLDAYSNIVKSLHEDAEKGELFQFWQDFPADFVKNFPEWKVIASGVELEVDKKPKYGELYWGLLEKVS